jgi:CheY-like chemotaxis protein
MIKFAKEAGIERVQFNTVGTMLDRKAAEEICLAGLDKITISLDGASEETYCKIRDNSDFNTVIDNINSFIEYKIENKITFTPLEGYSEVVAGFLESSDPDKWNIKIGWADAPHLTPEIVEKMSRKYLPSQLKARSLGEPAMGEGAIYPIELDLIVVDDFPIPQAWPKVYGLDVGKTAGVPKLDGFALCAELRRLEAATPVLMLTAKGQVSNL